MVLKNVEFKESELKRDPSIEYEDKNLEEDVPLKIPPHHHRLQYQYWFWYSKRTPGKVTSVKSYDDNLKFIQKFGTVEQFWEIYTHLVRPSEIQSYVDLHLFKVGKYL